LAAKHLGKRNLSYLYPNNKIIFLSEQKKYGFGVVKRDGNWGERGFSNDLNAVEPESG
jgi:hypothetical protein